MKQFFSRSKASRILDKYISWINEYPETGIPQLERSVFRQKKKIALALIYDFLPYFNAYEFLAQGSECMEKFDIKIFCGEDNPDIMLVQLFGGVSFYARYSTAPMICLDVLLTLVLSGKWPGPESSNVVILIDEQNIDYTIYKVCTEFNFNEKRPRPKSVTGDTKIAPIVKSKILLVAGS